MKKLNKVAVLFASAALAAPLASFAAAHGGMAAPKANDNWRAGDGTVVKNGTNELCWRDAGWTPATADQACDGAIKPPPPPPPPAPPPPPPPPVAPPVAPPQAPLDAPAVPAAPVVPRVAPPPPAPVTEKVTYAADALFDFAKSALKPDAQARLTDLVDKTKGINLEVIIAVGHADSIGNAAANLRLSTARADAVKNFLASKGIEPSRIYTEGKGSTSPVADNSTAEGRAKNRRVEVEVVGTRTRR